MNASISADREERTTFQLRFESLFSARLAYAFPCNAAGHVDMDALDESARNDYLYARAVVGREVSVPKVQTVPRRAPCTEWVDLRDSHAGRAEACRSRNEE